MKRLFLALMLSIGLPVLCMSQISGLDVKRIANEDGLSNSSVICITQDKEGRMWFGTWDGLNVYDGRQFRYFKPYPSDPYSISNNVIRSISEGNNGEMWISTDKGINRLNVANSTFKRWFSHLGVTSENAYKLAVDSKGSVYAIIDGYGCYKYYESEDDFRLVFPYDKAVASFVDSHSGLCILSADGDLERYTFDSKDEISSKSLIFKDVCLATISPDGETVAVHFHDHRLVLFNLSDQSQVAIPRTDHIRAMAFSSETLLYADAVGLHEYGLKSHASTDIALEEKIISVYQGSQGIIWVGTDMRGVLKMVDKRNAFFTAYPENEIPLFGNDAVRSFCKMDDGSLLVGTKGSGLFLFKTKGNVSHLRYSTSNGLIDDSVYSLVKDDNGRIWIGTDGVGLNYFDGKRIHRLDMNGAKDVSSVYSIIPWDENTLFVGTAGNGLYMLALSGDKVISWGKIADGIVYSILKDGNTLLYGTRGHGVWKYDVKTGGLAAVSNSLSDLDILTMHFDSNRRLWLGTSTGLYSLDYDNAMESDVVILTERENLPNNTIHAILEDMNHNLWVSTNNGLGRIANREDGYKITSYYSADGLYGNEFCDGASYATNDGREFFFGNIGGLTVFDPLSISSSSYLPHILLSSLKINNEETALTESTLKLSGDVGFVSFTFSPIDYINGHRCKISYRVDGGDKDWIDIGNTGTIVLNKLKRGRHTLYVRCSTTDGEWGEPEFVLPITVRVQWYLSIIAIIAYALIFLTIISLLAWSILQRVRERDKMRNRETAHEAKLKFFTDIAHEFSNSLTLIYGPCVQILSNPSIDANTKRYASLIENSSERMRTLIQELIDFRKAETGHLSLHCNVVDLRSLAEREMNYFSDMMSERKVSTRIELGEGVSTWRTDQDSLEKMVFNLLSNASKYTPAGGSIKLRIDIIGGKLVTRVTNYGVGISKDKMESIFNRFTVLDRYEKDVSRGRRTTSNGIGLAMCNALAELLEGSISVDSDGSSYVKFEIILPEMNDAAESMTAGAGHLSEWRPSPVENPSDKQSRSEYEEPDTNRGPIMLVVDDEQQIRQFITDLFSSEFLVVQADNGNTALEEVSKRRPDIIISDVIMPGMGGVEMLKVLKNNDLTKRIPVILLSSKDTVENQIEGLTEGAGSFLGKPFNPKQLVALVDSTLKRDKAIIEYNNSSLSAVDMFEGKVLKNNVRELLASVTEVVYKNLNNENLTVELIAEQIAVSKMKLYRVIKESLDLTPTQFIRNLRIDHAEKLLKTTNMTVQEIIYACGFSSKAYFYKVFTERVGLTPKEYREKEKNS